MPFEVGLDAKSTARIFEYFQKALKRAENETVRDRVEKASICAYRAVLETAGHWELRGGILRAVFPEKYGDVVNDYIALTKKHGETRAEEWQPIAHYYGILRKATQEGYHGARLENKIWRVTVVGDDNGKLIELRHQPDKRELLMPAKYRDLRHAFEHLTLSELGEQGYNLTEPGPFAITRQGSGLLLTKTLKDGTSVQRHLAFAERDPGVVCCQTIITHRGAEPQTYQLRVHPEFNTGRATTDARVVSAYIRDGDWVMFNEGWRGDEAPKRDELQGSHPTGYAFYNHQDRFGMMVTCDPHWVERPGFWWSDTYPQANLDLYTKPILLKPGESFSFHYELEYLARPPVRLGQRPRSWPQTCRRAESPPHAHHQASIRVPEEFDNAKMRGRSRPMPLSFRPRPGGTRANSNVSTLGLATQRPTSPEDVLCFASASFIKVIHHTWGWFYDNIHESRVHCK